MSVAAALHRLQDADDHVAALQHQLAAAEQRLRRDDALERQRALSAEREAARQEAQANSDAAQTAARSVDMRVRGIERRLYDGSVHNPQELVAMQREAAQLRQELAALEEAALLRMQAAEDAEAGARAAAATLAADETRRTAELEPLRAEAARLHAELDDAVAWREQVAAELPAGDLSLYTRVAAHHRPAVVSLAGDSCGGCHLPLSIEERRAARSGSGVVQCSSCDRILTP